MSYIYTGSTGSGKSTKLQEKYEKLAREVRTEEILVFTNDSNSVRRWRNDLDLNKMGSLHIYSYFGFLQREIQKYWDLIEEDLGERKALAPIFMTVEPAHYLMTQLVEKEREKGSFKDVRSTSSQIGVQLIDNLNYSELNGLSIEEVGDRLVSLADNGEKKFTYKIGLKVMKGFRKLCLERRCIDYSLLLHLYNKYLVKRKGYLEELKGRYKYLIIDDLEKMVPVAQDLIDVIMQGVEETYISFNEEGDFAKFFGSAPQLAKERFVNGEKIIELEESYTSSKEGRELAQKLGDRILDGREVTPTPFIKKIIKEELRGEMIFKIGEEISSLLAGGINPKEIAIITPFPDKVLEFNLESYLKENGHQLISLSKNRLLLDNSFAQGLIVLTLLVKREWEIEISTTAITQVLNLILDLDPIRSSLLAQKVKENKMVLPNLDHIGIRGEIGFSLSEKYDKFREWVEDRREEELELEYFFRSAFGGILSPLHPQAEDILSCRQLINSFVKFKKVMKEFKDFEERDLGHRFIQMINEGTLAADLLVDSQAIEEKVILATPYSFLAFPYIESVKYLFLLDTSSELWYLGASKELSNPYILARENEEGEWNDLYDRKAKEEQLVSYLKGILAKVTHGLYLGDSKLDSRGWEQTGELAEVFNI
ncbi:UvrD-helicase domain-containing protein [Halonatronum saccharophilum]|uniref:UvrD-helicase domain-containing protein n=1 Tax=Halonatronum saccharophilum TaxID=150060 RepID=UPI000482138A|nr:UvrD-helicase domain-containing protein [Halonatronum saccharophilum]